MSSQSRPHLKPLAPVIEIERPVEPEAANGAEPAIPVVYDSSTRVIAILAIVVALWWGKAVIVPVVLSILISYALEPLIACVEGLSVRRAIAVPILLAALSAATGLAAYALRGEAAAFVGRMPDALHTVSQTIERVYQKRTGGPGTLAKMKDAANELEKATRGGDAQPGEPATAVRIEQPAFKWSDWALQGSRSAMAFGGQLLFVVCLTYSLLVAGDLYKRKLVRIMPTLSDKKLTVQILDEINRQIERFLMARVLISLIVGAAFALSFHVIGMLEAGVWGVIAALLFTVPIVGPAAVVIGATVAAFVQFGTASATIGVAGLGVAISAVEGNVLTPLLMRRVGEMSAAAIFVSLIFWGWIWGGWGLLLAVPIMASIKAVCERVPEFSPVAELLRA